MQAVGRRYVGGFNASYRRTGTLWEGRFKSALVDSLAYLLTCYRYARRHGAGTWRLSVVESSTQCPRCARTAGHPALRLAIARHRRCVAPAFLPRTVRDRCRRRSDGRIARLYAAAESVGSERFKRQIEVLTERAAGLAPRERPKYLGNRENVPDLFSFSGA